MPSPDSAADRVSTRKRALRLFREGATQAQVARAVGVSRVTAWSWHRRWRIHGAAGLLAPRPRGRRPKLGNDRVAAVLAPLARSPRDAGFALDTWSLAAVAALIQKRTGIHYHPRHVGRVLRRGGWIVPPVGRRREAMRVRYAQDPDGNPVGLIERIPMGSTRPRSDGPPPPVRDGPRIP